MRSAHSGIAQSMRVLAIETATEACSVALFEGGKLLDARHEIIGRGHAERLVPMIAELPGKGRADEILVSLGPGSFTGTRIGLAAGRALAIAWGSRVRGYPTLALIASMARSQYGEAPVDVAMAGGHGEIYFQRFDAAGRPIAGHISLSIGDAASNSRESLAAGNRANELIALRGAGEAYDILPDARFVLNVPRTLLTEALAPLYGRPPDAKPPR